MLVRSLFRTCRSPNQRNTYPKGWEGAKRAARPFLFGLNNCMATFITPYSGTAELKASNGLEIISQGSWVFNKFNLADAATFYLSLSYPTSAYNGEFSYGAPPAPTSPVSGGELHLSATDWTIADIGNELTSYTDPDTYVIQGSGVEGGAQDTFSDHEFYCRLTELATTDNSNYEFQSNTTSRPVWAYSYSKSWQTD